MNSPSKEILLAYETADILALRRYPYFYSGGHNSSFAPTGDPAGYDCSSWCSVILHRAGILYADFPLDTHAFENWGYYGRGEFMTLWTINIPNVINHCFLEFTIPGKPHHISMAAETGTICGWWPYMLSKGYMPRRRK